MEIPDTLAWFLNSVAIVFHPIQILAVGLLGQVALTDTDRK